MKQQTSAAPETGNKGKQQHYEGRVIYVGIDVHKKDWQVAAFYEGITLGNHRMGAGAEGVITHLRKRYPGASFKCVYESCGWGFELQRKLSAAGLECIVVNAADVPGSNKEKSNKTDKTDAERLARHHGAGLLKAIHVPDEQLQKHRNLIRFRKRVVADLGRSKNRLKSILKYQGIEIPRQFDNSSWSNNFLEWVSREAQKDQDLTDILLLMLEEIRALKSLLLNVNRKVRALTRHERYQKMIERLMSIPGVGEITAITFLLEVGDIRRFKRFDQLNSMVGFYPDSHSSGETNRHTGISNRSNKYLRSMLIESSWQLIRHDMEMNDMYQELKKRMKGTEAIVRIARKLLRKMRAMLLTDTAYELNIAA
ncbi:MAG TPA: IS110 family transposase [Agriterribacter sp.]|nr:IS110 family transposase [Agriterribacter sp.]